MTLADWWPLWLGIAGLGLAIPELIAVFNKVPGDTLSERLRAWLHVDTARAHHRMVVVMRRLVTILAAITLALTVLFAAPTAAQAKPRTVRCHATQWIDHNHGQQQCYRRYPHHPWADGWYWEAWGPTWWWGWYSTPYWWLV